MKFEVRHWTLGKERNWTDTPQFPDETSACIHAQEVARAGHTVSVRDHGCGKDIYTWRAGEGICRNWNGERVELWDLSQSNNSPIPSNPPTSPTNSTPNRD